MIRRLRELYRRADLLQERRWFRIAALIVVVLGAIGAFGPLIATSNRLETQRGALVRALTGQSIPDGGEHALSLRDTGTVTVGGRTYGSPVLKERLDLIFDESGTIAVPGELAEVLLRAERPQWAPAWLLERPGTTWLLALVTTGWLVLVVLMRTVPQCVLVALGTAAAAYAARAAGAGQLAVAIGGVGLLTFTFLLLNRAAQAAFDRPDPVLAVAHTVLREASRTRIGLVFIVLLLVLLPLLPLGLDPASPLRYRIQTFIARSLGLTFYISACLTLFLACATVSFEVRDRQIWQIVTKPVHRFRYLLGKWLGVVTVNATLLAIAAVSIFTFIQFLRDQPVAAGIAGQEDAQQVRDAVLTARIGTRPEYPMLAPEQLRLRVEETIARDPELASLPEVPLTVRRRVANDILMAFSAGQRAVPPADMRTYSFSGLDAARRAGGMLTLRYKFHILRDDEHRTFPARFIFNEDPQLYVVREYVPTMTHVLSIPAELVQEDGTLKITIENGLQPTPELRGYGSLNFEAEDFELLYKVGSFEANFLRAILVDWTKLAFLAMLGIGCATFLSFPVACLTSFTIFAAGTVGPFLAQSLRDYYPPAISAVDWTDAGMVIQWAFQSFIRLVAQAVVVLLEAFGAYRPTQALVEGRLIPWNVVLGAAVRIGFVWSGLALVVGWLVLRRRQLAIYSGHG